MLPESSVPGWCVVRYEAVEHDDVAGDAAAEVQGRHHCGQPDPLAPLLQVEGVEEVGQSWESSPCHVEGEEGEPAKLVTPAPEVEGEENGNDIVGDGDDVVKADDLQIININQVTTVARKGSSYLLLHCRVLGGVGVLLNMRTKLRRQIEFLFWKESIPNDPFPGDNCMLYVWKSLANIEMDSPSTYFVEQHLVISEGANPVGQAVQEHQGLQGHLAQTVHHSQTELWGSLELSASGFIIVIISLSRRLSCLWWDLLKASICRLSCD